MLRLAFALVLATALAGADAEAAACDAWLAVDDPVRHLEGHRRALERLGDERLAQVLATLAAEAGTAELRLRARIALGRTTAERWFAHWDAASAAAERADRGDGPWRPSQPGDRRSAVWAEVGAAVAGTDAEGSAASRRCRAAQLWALERMLQPHLPDERTAAMAIYAFVAPGLASARQAEWVAALVAIGWRGDLPRLALNALPDIERIPAQADVALVTGGPLPVPENEIAAAARDLPPAPRARWRGHPRLAGTIPADAPRPPEPDDAPQPIVPYAWAWLLAAAVPLGGVVVALRRLGQARLRAADDPPPVGILLRSTIIIAVALALPVGTGLLAARNGERYRREVRQLADHAVQLQHRIAFRSGRIADHERLLRESRGEDRLDAADLLVRLRHDRLTDAAELARVEARLRRWQAFSVWRRLSGQFDLGR